MTFKDLALGYVATAPSPGDSGLSLVLNSGEGAYFPQPSTDGDFYVTAFPPGVNPNMGNAEILKVTARSTDTFTIVRAQKSTTAKSIAVGWIILQGIYASDVYPVIDDDTMATASATNLSTSEATKAYVDNGTWLKDSMARQAIINGNFDVWQRGTSVALADVTLTYQADHWFDYIDKNGGTLPTLTRSRQILTSGDIPNAFYYTRLATNGAGTSLGVSSIGGYFQRIENGVRLLCGLNKKVTISFWARSDIANKRLGLSIFQKYGSGGSPTADEKIITQAPITLSTTWTKYTATFTTNTLVGKTFGTANDDSLQVNFSYMWGTTTGNADVYPSVSAETFVGSGNIDIAQVQLCAGDVALPFMPKSFEEELRACQRYYQQAGAGIVGDIELATQVTFGIVFPVKMRIAPTPSILDSSIATRAGGADITSSGSTFARTTLYDIGGEIIVSGFTGLIYGSGIVIRNSTPCFDFSAEL